MPHSLFMSNRRRSHYILSLIFLLFINIEFHSPSKGSAQSFSDTGSFYFSGNHTPLRRPIFRELLPGDGVKVGQVKIHPFLGVAEVYTDNVFRTNTRRRSDFLTTIAPGIQVNVPIGIRHSFLLDYRATQFLYRKFSENDVLSQHGVGHLTLDFPGGIKVDLQGGHIEGFDSRGSEVDLQQRDITQWNVDSFLGQGNFLGSNFGVRLKFFFTDRHFTNNNQAAPRDRTRIRTQFTVFVPATQAISGLLGVQLTNQTYDTNRQLNSFSYGMFTGFRLKPSRRLYGEFNIGYTILNFDRAPISDPVQVTVLEQTGLNSGGNQVKALTMRGDINWNPTPQWNIYLRPYRRIRQAAVFNTSTFTQTGVSLQVTRALTPRLSARGRVFYEHNAFEEGRRDNRFRWRMGMGYKTIEWLGFRVDYILAKRFSNQNTFDFFSNTVMVSIQGFR